MVKIPQFKSGGTLKADDLNQLARAVAELRNGAGSNRAGHGVIGGRGATPFRAAGAVLLLTDAEGKESVQGCAGAWGENDAHAVAQDAVVTAEVGRKEGAGGELLMDAMLMPADATAPLTSWKPQEKSTPQVVFEPWEQPRKDAAAEDAGEDEAVVYRPRRAMVRVMPQATADGRLLAAESMWYGQPQAAVWFKASGCTNKENANATAAVLLPGEEWQTLYLRQAVYYYRAGSKVRGNVWAWGIQGKMDAFGFVRFRSVCVARGAYHFGF